MISTWHISGQPLRIAVLACYIAAVFACGGLHFHLEHAHSDVIDASGHFVLHAHAHSHHEHQDDSQSFAFAHPLHDHEVAEFESIATRSKNASESFLRNVPAYHRAFIPPPASIGLQKAGILSTDIPVQYRSALHRSALPPRAPPTA